MNPSIGRWIVNLAVISIIGVVVDLFLPNGSMKKYVRFLIGIVILTAMLKPILQMFNQLPALDRYTAQAFATMEYADVSHKAKWLKGQQQSEIREYFMKNMESYMEQQIKQLKGYQDVTVDVEMDENFRDESQLPDGLRVYVDVGITASSSYVEPVRIKIDTKDVNNSHNDENSREEQEIKALLSSIYGIAPDRIEVRFKDDLRGTKKNDEQKLQEGEVP